MGRDDARIHRATFGLLSRETLSTPEQRGQVHDDIGTDFVHAHHLYERLASDSIDMGLTVRSSGVLSVGSDLAHARNASRLIGGRWGSRPKASSGLDHPRSGLRGSWVGVALF